MNEPDANDTVEVIDVEEPAAELIAEPVAEPVEVEAVLPPEPGNPDAWLQWALIIGLLALFLICAILILIGWNNR